ncbi:mCG147706 [Mus musculus]|nr:mCG147706 [Mus musculus]
MYIWHETESKLSRETKGINERGRGGEEQRGEIQEETIAQCARHTCVKMSLCSMAP